MKRTESLFLLIFCKEIDVSATAGLSLNVDLKMVWNSTDNEILSYILITSSWEKGMACY